MWRKLTVMVLIFIFTFTSCKSGWENEDENTVRIGVTVYDQYDTFVNELMEKLSGELFVLEQQTGVTITVMNGDAGGSQEEQNNQVEDFIKSGCDIICVNLVERMDASVIIDKAETAGIPIIFFNRELVEEDLLRNDSLFYVGADAAESGVLQAEIVLEMIKNDPGKIDKNGDEIYQYVMLEGETGHQDSVMRTEYVINTVIDSGIELERIEDEIANWKRSEAKTKMMQWLAIYDNDIEIVFANNDDMALGAIDALEQMEILSENWPVVVGIDGTNPGLESVMLGKMSGTVLNDSTGQAKKIAEIIYALYSGNPLPPLKDKSYARLPYKIITRENVADYFSFTPKE